MSLSWEPELVAGIDQRCANLNTVLDDLAETHLANLATAGGDAAKAVFLTAQSLAHWAKARNDNERALEVLVDLLAAAMERLRNREAVFAERINAAWVENLLAVADDQSAWIDYLDEGRYSIDGSFDLAALAERLARLARGTT